MITSQNEEQKISQNSIASLINDYEKQREKIGNIRDNDAINESHATIRSILKFFVTQETHEGSSNKRKSQEAEIEEKNYPLKKLKISSPNLKNFDIFKKQTQ